MNENTGIKSEKDREPMYIRILAKIEKAGNRLPDPVVLFAFLCVLLLIISYFTAGASVVHPGTGETITAVNLLTIANLQKILINFPSNFLGFAPLGAVLTIMLGCGLAEKSGWLTSMVRLAGARASGRTVTVIVVFAGIMANQAGDAGWIVLPPLAALLFLSVGRNPLVGIFAAYASVSTGMAANLLISMSDVLAGTFTISAAQSIAPGFSGNIAMNYYFLIVSTFILLFTGVITTDKIVEPRLGEYKGDVRLEHDANLAPEEKKGIKWAGVCFIAICLAIVALCIGPDAFLADPETGSIMSNNSPLMKGIISIVTIMFFVPAVVYGRVAGTIKSSKDIVNMLIAAMKDMGGYIVLVFVSAQFTSWFSQSNLATVFAVKGAEFLENTGITGIGLIIGLIIVSGIINLFIGSASAKWAIMAPIFVPMFMILGLHPSVTQMSYRIGDSITNVLSPLFPYVMILLSYVQKYDKKAGWGTLFSNMLPYSLVMGIAWSVILIVFVLFKIPLGPSGPIFYSLG